MTKYMKGINASYVAHYGGDSEITMSCNVPVSIARQLMKHQIGMSWNEVSRRYTTDGMEFFEPEEWRKAPDASIKQGSSTEVVTHLNDTRSIVSAYADHVAQSEKLFTQMIDSGVAPEMARLVLPQSMDVQFVWTGSLLAWAHVYNLRSKPNAQKEVQAFASHVDDVMTNLFPVAWKVLTHQ